MLMQAYALLYLLFHQNKNNDKNIICFDWELPIKLIRVFYGLRVDTTIFLIVLFLGVLQKKVVFYQWVMLKECNGK
jgi:hypothetical protein